MDIYIVRHGLTKTNKDRKYFGKIDSDLSIEGESQIRKLIPFFEDINFDKIYVSSKKRTHQTANIVKPNQEFIVCSGLDEADMGDFEGLTYNEIKKKYPKAYEKWETDFLDFSPPNGESFMNFYKRVTNSFKDILEDNDSTILIISHGGVMRALLAYVMDNQPSLYWKFAVYNACVVRLKYEYGNLFLDALNMLGDK